MSDERKPDLLQSTTAIVVAQLSTTVSPPGDVPTFIRTVYETLRDLEASGAAAPSAPVWSSTPAVSGTTEHAKAPVPAVPINESITHDTIICLEDGKPLRMLKRYLMTQFGMTPQDYRAKWGLPSDYPMVAPAVTEQRSATARQKGLGK